MDFRRNATFQESDGVECTTDEASADKEPEADLGRTVESILGGAVQQEVGKNDSSRTQQT